MPCGTGLRVPSPRGAEFIEPSQAIGFLISRGDVAYIMKWAHGAWHHQGILTAAGPEERSSFWTAALRKSHGCNRLFTSRWDDGDALGSVSGLAVAMGTRNQVSLELRQASLRFLSPPLRARSPHHSTQLECNGAPA
jgi:hypothetical protein